MNKVNKSAETIRQENEKYKNEEISFTPHICRHTYATDLYYSGIDVKTAQYLLGHSSIKITLDIYTHLDKTKISDSIDSLNQYFSQSKVSQNPMEQERTESKNDKKIA